jgi:hypothetical protein
MDDLATTLESGTPVCFVVNRPLEREVEGIDRVKLLNQCLLDGGQFGRSAR